MGSPMGPGGRDHEQYTATDFPLQELKRAHAVFDQGTPHSHPCIGRFLYYGYPLSLGMGLLDGAVLRYLLGLSVVLCFPCRASNQEGGTESGAMVRRDYVHTWFWDRSVCGYFLSQNPDGDG